jgi:hypothetical protein
LPICLVFSAFLCHILKTKCRVLRIECYLLTCVLRSLPLFRLMIVLLSFKTVWFGFFQGREEGGEHWRQTCSSGLLTAQGWPFFDELRFFSCFLSGTDTWCGEPNKIYGKVTHFKTKTTSQRRSPAVQYFIFQHELRGCVIFFIHFFPAVASGEVPTVRHICCSYASK